MKLLYKFTHRLKDGKEVTLALRKPTRLELDDADMMFSKFQSECIQRGILTKEMLVKTIKNFGGVLSNKEEKEYSKIFSSFVEAKQKLDKAKDKKKREILQREIDLYYSSLRDIEMEHEHLFDRTADVIARNKTIMHLALLIGLIDRKVDENDEHAWEPLFKGDEFEERYFNFSEQEEEDSEDTNNMLSRLSLFTTFWYYGDKSINEANFKEYDELTRADFYELISTE